MGAFTVLVESQQGNKSIDIRQYRGKRVMIGIQLLIAVAHLAKQRTTKRYWYLYSTGTGLPRWHNKPMLVNCNVCGLAS